MVGPLQSPGLGLERSLKPRRWSGTSPLAESVSPDSYTSYRAMQAAYVTIDMARLEISSLRAAEVLAWEQTEQAVAKGETREGLYSRFLGVAIEEQVIDLFEIMGYQ